MLYAFVFADFATRNGSTAPVRLSQHSNVGHLLGQYHLSDSAGSEHVRQVCLSLSGHGRGHSLWNIVRNSLPQADGLHRAEATLCFDDRSIFKPRRFRLVALDSTYG